MAPLLSSVKNEELQRVLALGRSDGSVERHFSIKLEKTASGDAFCLVENAFHSFRRSAGAPDSFLIGIIPVAIMYRTQPSENMSELDLGVEK